MLYNLLQMEEEKELGEEQSLLNDIKKSEELLKYVCYFYTDINFSLIY